ncbi:MAG: peptidase MA family metallohydrolase [Chloroflexota bacterium]
MALAVAIARPMPAAAFSGFGAVSADATYGLQMRFKVALPGGPPDKLQLLLRFAGSEDTVVAPVVPGASSAEYLWDAKARPLTPNTAIAYRWRATAGDVVSLSPEKNLLYDDDRPGLDWHVARIGDATVHWYGGAEAQARHFGKITADAAAAAETLLGHKLAGPVDIFVYASHDDFFGALGPGAREWTGAATFPALRTIFMWLQGGSSSYLETTMTHEVTHVVFHDATANAFHDPATWFNEGLAVWSEQHTADPEAATVRSATGSGLLAFDGISESFPIGDQAARLAYAEGATMVSMIIDRYGRGAIAKIAAAWRDGAGDAEALEAGTGVPAKSLYDDYFSSFGAKAPTAVDPAPIGPSNVSKPPQPAASGNQQASSSPAPVTQPNEKAADITWIVAVVAVGLVVGTVIALVLRRRRQPPGLA